MEQLDLTLPRKTYLVDFLAEINRQPKKDSWFFVHESIMSQLVKNNGFEKSNGMKNFLIFYSSEEKMEIVVESAAFRDWYTLVEIRKMCGKYESLYDVYKVEADDTGKAKYNIWLSREA